MYYQIHKGVKLQQKGIIILLGVNFMKIMLHESCIFNIFAENTAYLMHIY